MNDFVEILRERALHLKLEADKRFGGAVDVQSLVKALGAIERSYSNYLDAELRDKVKGKITKTIEKEIAAFKKESALLVVDLNFASFGAAIVSNSVTTSGSFAHFKNAQQLKQESFDHYKKDAFFADHNDPKVLAQLKERFTPEERSSIFSPLYKDIFSTKSFSFQVGKTAKTLHPVHRKTSEAAQKTLMPVVHKTLEPSGEKLVALYGIVEDNVDLFGQRNIKFKKRLAVQSMDKDTYPYQSHEINYGNAKVILKRPITAKVEFVEDENLYFISFGDLELSAWGDTRQQAEEAFNFAFVDTVKTYYLEDDSRLTKKAIALKQQLAALIQNVDGI